MEDPATGEDVAYDVKRRLVSFNGATQSHETAPYTGERFTCVWYTSTIGSTGAEILPLSEQIGATLRMAVAAGKT